MIVLWQWVTSEVSYRTYPCTNEFPQFILSKINCLDCQLRKSCLSNNHFLKISIENVQYVTRCLTNNSDENTNNTNRVNSEIQDSASCKQYTVYSFEIFDYSITNQMSCPIHGKFVYFVISSFTCVCTGVRW